MEILGLIVIGIVICGIICECLEEDKQNDNLPKARFRTSGKRRN